MKFGKTMIIAAVAFAAFVIGSTPTQAQEYGRHPAYLHALSDLRLMRSYLEPRRPDERVDPITQRAIDEIDAAIRAIKDAAIEDGKDLRDHHPPADADITPGGRFRKAREAGNAAWHHLDREEDNAFAHGLKHRAMDHIESANHLVDHQIGAFANRDHGDYRDHGNYR